MRPVFLITALAAAALAGAALAAAPKAAPKFSSANASARPPRAVEAGPELPGGRMLGATTSQIRSRLGAPDVAHAEGRGAFWTYRLPDCALFVFFQDEGKGLKVSGLSSGPRKRGQTAAGTEDCLSAAEDR